MSELQNLAKIFEGDVSWIHDGLGTEKELAERGDGYIRFLFNPSPDLKLRNGFRALEIGSGLGYIMEALERYAQLQGLQVGRIIGLDIAAPMIEKAEVRLAGRAFELLLYDGVHIPLEDSSLDFVYSVATLQHIPKRFVYNLFFEIKRLLSPNGFSLLHLLGFSHIPICITPWAEIVRLQLQEGERSTGWVYFYSAEELRRVLGDGTALRMFEWLKCGGRGLSGCLEQCAGKRSELNLEQGALSPSVQPYRFCRRPACVSLPIRH
jgi:ubiquinone/menaquinone biosynthesis C-methylase UbiE